MGANETQVGGSHYKTEYEHWDLAIVCQLPYMEGTATKYVARWRKKNGLEELQKALHYHDKLLEVATCTWSPRVMKQAEITKEVQRFALANKLCREEEEYIHLLCSYRSKLELELARGILCALIEVAKAADFIINETKKVEPNYPGTPENGGHHEQGTKEED